jgi:adenosylcobinamide kinase / adenosylcobinamide-phosphate guanylyltransferase
MLEGANIDGRLALLLGGARAGKSSYALRLTSECEQRTGGKVCFIATAQGLDEEMSSRIACHQAERPQAWATIEEPYGIDEALRQASDARVVIVDCLTLFVSNWLLRYEDESRCEQVLRRITDDFLQLARSRRQEIICVSNEVGLGIVPETKLGRTFRDLLGRTNQDFAWAADDVYLLVAGLPLRIKPQKE